MRKSISVFIFLFSILILISGCSSSSDYKTKKFNLGTGKYNFEMSDSLGKPIAGGTLNLITKENENISGNYNFTKIYQKDFPGLSTMEGDFAGNISDSGRTVFINTNPRIADSNVFWNMKIKNNALTGEWVFSQFRGAVNKGKIKITK
jgi:hypothetical protein